MIVESLTLHNFGVYQGKNKITFPSDAKANVVVFMGKNGSGKTTIFEALKIALYGPLLYGYKTANDSYLDIIKEKINNKAFACKEESYLNLTFLKRENSENIRYKIIRKWKFNSSSISEELIVYREDTKLSNLEIIILENYLRQFLPPSLIDIFFFDGEKLSYLSEAEILEKKLRESIDTIFNINIFSQLIKDLNLFLKQKEVDSKLSHEEKKLRNLREKSENLQEKLDNFTKEKQNKKIELQKLDDYFKALRNEMSLHGALEKEELVNLKIKYKELQKEKEELYKRKRHILSNLFPFQISRDLLIHLKERVEHEQFNSKTKILVETLKKDNLLKKAIKKSLNKQLLQKTELNEFVNKVIFNIEKNTNYEDNNKFTDLQLT
ncbi:MAG: AAA family ATPase, partial [Candidatus Heimdallarchaeaceae archaeon]